MLFNSFAFVIFFVLVTTLFFVLPHNLRWLMLLLASCFFYMFFVPIFILVATIIIDYLVAILIENTPNSRKKKFFLSMSIVSVCTVLFVFKYFNFFERQLRRVGGGTSLELFDWCTEYRSAHRSLLPHIPEP